MHDWTFEPGHDPLPLTLPEQPWSPDQGAAPWLSPLPADDFETWLPIPQAKTDLGDVGPMFLEDEGTPIDDVIVPWRGYSGGGYYDGGYSQGWEGYDTSGDDRGQSDPQEPTFQGEDCATAAITNEINNRPTNNDKEHSAIVYIGGDGLYRTSPVFSGVSGSAPLHELITWMISSGVDFNQITSLYHNHDSLTGADNADEIAVNRYPSTSAFAANGIGDWVIAADFVRLGANPDVFKLTIEDTAGVARDFAYADKAKYENLTLEQMKNGMNLPGAETGCGP